MNISGIMLGLGCALSAGAAELFVAPNGSDANPGTREQPLASLAAAQRRVRGMPQRTREPITVCLRGGVYYLPEALVFTPADSGAPGAAVDYRAAAGEEAVLSGGFPLTGLRWEPCSNGIFRAQLSASAFQVSGLKFQVSAFDQLFVNGARMPLARYPNFDAGERIFNGYAADAISPARVATWRDPAGGFIHAMHSALWGGMHYRITGKDAQGQLQFEGGWQNNRPSAPHKQYRFVENIFEELDAPGEWFHDAKTGTLYFYPPAGLDPATAQFEGVRLRTLVEFRGSEARPVRHLALSGLTFRHAARTFMDNKEPMLRTDWTVYRGGAIFINGAEDCRIENCLVDQVGGNAIFVNNYNRRVQIRGCHIAKAGGNGIAFIGDPQAVRNAIGWKEHNEFSALDQTPGPQSQNFPADSLVEDCLIHETGRVEKQTAGVEIDMARNITVRHCSIYDLPRAGINIGDGCWGGHVIEFCDIFDTVKETGDHGSFNSWGRDRFWGLKGIDLNTVTLGENKNLPVLDAVSPNVLRNNRWRCDHGWDIDLDDGSSNYEIHDNLCLNGGLKNREGFYRTVENNIMVNNSFHPHVWYKHSEDVFAHNIVCTAYKPIGVSPPWGRACDSNLLHAAGQATPAPATRLQEQSGRDAHSLVADALFVDPASGDFRVKAGSPALQLGFHNFPMDQFGVQKPELKKLARTPSFVAGREEVSQRDGRVHAWLGAKIKNVVGLGEVSAAGLHGEVGVRLVAVPAGSAAARAGLKEGDVLLKCNGKPTDDVSALLRAGAADGAQLDLWRDQAGVVIELKPGARPAPERQPVKGLKLVVETRDDVQFEQAPRVAGGAHTAAWKVTANVRTANEPLATLLDGQIADNYGPVVPNGTPDAMYKLELDGLRNIAQINTYAFNQGAHRGRQCFALYGSSAAADPGWDVADAATFTFIAEVDTATAKPGRYTATSVQGAVGKFRWLVWALRPLNVHPGEYTAFQELSVVAVPEK
jgi:hypothetical protein